jgi:hypothetical protein
MITINLDDDNVVENFKALNELRKTGAFTDKQLQILYDKQVKADKEKALNRNLTDTETAIYNKQLEAEAITLNDVSLPIMGDINENK